MKKTTHFMSNTVSEITFKGVFLGILLAIVLAASNTFLALKIGFVTLASILSMSILRFFKENTILFI